MRHLRCVLLAAVVVALSASSAAAAHHPHAGGGAVVTPAGPHVLAQWYKTFLEMPEAVNPVWGSGEDPCVRFGPGGKLLAAISFGEVSCTAELGTVLTTGVAHFCSTFDDPTSPFFAVSKKDQRRCARAVSTWETAVSVTVDDGQTVDIFQRPYAALSPQTAVQLPVGAVFGEEAQAATITAYGWMANVRSLGVGTHLITTEVSFQDGGTFRADHFITIVPRGE
jgi:hypothetical protein